MNMGLGPNLTNSFTSNYLEIIISLDSSKCIHIFEIQFCELEISGSRQLLQILVLGFAINDSLLTCKSDQIIL